MAVSGLMLRAALAGVGAVGKQMRSFDELAAGADGALRAAPPGLTVPGAAAFLATMAQESDYFRTTVEYGGRTAKYAPHWGRGFEMVTWVDNYERFGGWCHARGWVADPHVFARHPDALADYRWAWLTGTWYFEYARLWGYANRGDFLAVSQGVNRGVGAIGTGKLPNGWDARRRMYDAFLAAGPVLLPTGGGPAPDTGRRRRRALLIN